VIVFSSRRRHTRFSRDWSSDVCSSDLAAQADVLITSAGVSVGDADFTKQVIDELGQVSFWKVAMKPGKPFAFGRLQNCWFFGLQIGRASCRERVEIVVDGVCGTAVSVI